MTGATGPADGRVGYPLRVNDVEVPVKDAWVGESLLFVLRERLGLAGAKQGCGRGECGACTVLVDGSVTAACVFPAIAAHGRDVRTVEGLLAGSDIAGHVQQGLIDAGAIGCGVCLPGIVVAASALLTRNATPSAPAIREALAGNLCRCVGTDRIVAAVAQAATRANPEPPLSDVGQATGSWEMPGSGAASGSGSGSAPGNWAPPPADSTPGGVGGGVGGEGVR